MNEKSKVAVSLLVIATFAVLPAFTLPATGFDLTYLLIIIAAVILLGAFIASFGAARMTR